MLDDADLDVEIEYQNETIGRYGLEVAGDGFLLTPWQTNCLARENCGISSGEKKEGLNQLSTQACCEPSTGRCK